MDNQTPDQTRQIVTTENTKLQQSLNEGSIPIGGVNNTEVQITEPKKEQEKQQERWEQNFLYVYKKFLVASKYSIILRETWISSQYAFKFCTDNIKKGGCDLRSYRYILLNNNMKVLVVSDSDS